MPLSVPAPASLAAPISVPLKTMTGPGPSNVADRVLQAQALPTLGHLHPEFTKVRDYRCRRAGEETALVEAFFLIVKTSRTFVSSFRLQPG